MSHDFIGNALRAHFCAELKAAWYEFGPVGLRRLYRTLDSLPAQDRVQAAVEYRVAIGVGYLRFSSFLTGTIASRIQRCAAFAARNRVVIPQDFVQIDVSGRGMPRCGRFHARSVIFQRHAHVLVLDRLLDLDRNAFKALRFLSEIRRSSDVRIGISGSESFLTNQQLDSFSALECMVREFRNLTGTREGRRHDRA